MRKEEVTNSQKGKIQYHTKFNNNSSNYSELKDISIPPFEIEEEFNFIPL